LSKLPPATTVTRLKHVATLPCDLSLIYYRCLRLTRFSDTNISQGSVATHLKWWNIKLLIY